MPATAWASAWPPGTSAPRYAAGPRGLVTLRGPDFRAAYLAGLLLDRSEEFRHAWDDHEIGTHPHQVKHFVHPEVGAWSSTASGSARAGPTP